ncbi:glmZ(sRNA)-inactivating NTPase [Rhodospirillum rubrum F11]|uniref:RNase adapter RapZ n=1 Tax=Rhodospirillum rubrum TaxID=1085 RepID=UPI000229D57D|nr:RNase adapter RapZ [Rhodospirillum rubrum]AEO49993.1 glmZ(sRNA)-inactivating NTPase [Rhodospirillum rubrum F11]
MPTDIAPDPAEAPPSPAADRRVIVVTGMSGAGRTTVLRALEDIGYEAVDNLPLSLFEALTQGRWDQPRPLVLGIDTRTRGFHAATVLAAIERLVAATGFDVRLLFIDCDDEVLVRRYTETRRRHPLAVDRPLADGIALERALVAPLKERASRCLDTSILPPAKLRAVIEAEFSLDHRPELAIFVSSFGFRNGLPREADLVFDVRFLANPHYEPHLREMTGLDPAVAAYVAADPDFAPLIDRVTALLALLVPRYEKEGKSYLTIAIGCTGGKHRSVYTAERLAAWLNETGRRAHVRHRDLKETPR